MSSVRIPAEPRVLPTPALPPGFPVQRIVPSASWLLSLPSSVASNSASTSLQIQLVTRLCALPRHHPPAALHPWPPALACHFCLKPLLWTSCFLSLHQIMFSSWYVSTVCPFSLSPSLFLSVSKSQNLLSFPLAWPNASESIF